MAPPSFRPTLRDARVALIAVVLFVMFDRAAAALGSTRGEAGFAVCGIVLVLTLGAEGLLTGAPITAALRALGLGPAAPRTLGFAAALGVLLLAFFPVFAAATATPLIVRADWAVLALGMLAQGGVAEETLFRGFLYRHLRERRSFWRGAALAAVPFVGAHLALFATLDFAVALAAVVVALSMTFPLARLFDLAGGSVWPGAILHATVQGAVKLVEPADASAALPFAIGWMVIGALAPWVVFALPAPQAAAARPQLSPP
jgi:membrane protease YdiL (CAAX protease family)